MRPVWLPDVHNQDSDQHPPGPVAQPFTSLHQVSGGQYDEDNQQHETWMMDRI